MNSKIKNFKIEKNRVEINDFVKIFPDDSPLNWQEQFKVAMQEYQQLCLKLDTGNLMIDEVLIGL